MKESSDYTQSIQRFKKFVSLRSRVVIVLSAVVMVCYYAFVLSVGLFPDVLGLQLGPSAITLGIIIGIFLIILCIVLTGLYTFFANHYFDGQQEEILKDLEHSGALEDLKNGKTY